MVLFIVSIETILIKKKIFSHQKPDQKGMFDEILESKLVHSVLIKKNITMCFSYTKGLSIIKFYTSFSLIF